MKSQKQVELSIAGYKAQDKLFRVLFNSVPAGRRLRIAMTELRRAAKAKGKTDEDLVRQLRSELKIAAKYAAKAIPMIEAEEVL